MTIRRSLLAGTLLFVGSWIIPGMVIMGLIFGMRSMVTDWGGLALLVGAITVGGWVQGMLMAAAVLLPLATWIQSLNPELSARRIMTVGLIVWAIPAVFVAQAVNAATNVWLKRYSQADCRAGVRIEELKMATDAAGRLIVHGGGRNAGPLVLSHLKVTIDGDPPRAKPETYGAHLTLTARIAEQRGDHFVVKGTITNNGRGVVRQARARLQATDALNRQIAFWIPNVVTYIPDHYDGECTPLRPGESREFTINLKNHDWILEDGPPREPVTLTAAPADLMVERLSEER